jgi:hypothetical protein
VIWRALSVPDPDRGVITGRRSLVHREGS